MAIINDSNEPATYEIGESHSQPLMYQPSAAMDAASIGTGLGGAALVTLGMCAPWGGGIAALGLLLVLAGITLHGINLVRGLLGGRSAAPSGGPQRMAYKGGGQKIPIKAGETHAVTVNANHYVIFCDEDGANELAQVDPVGTNNATVRLVVQQAAGGGVIYNAVVQ